MKLGVIEARRSVCSVNYAGSHCHSCSTVNGPSSFRRRSYPRRISACSPSISSCGSMSSIPSAIGVKGILQTKT
jgi:hypothetical protein